MTTVHQTAEEAIEASAERNIITRCRSTPGNRIVLKMESDAYIIENSGYLDAWGIDGEGRDWRVTCCAPALEEVEQ